MSVCKLPTVYSSSLPTPPFLLPIWWYFSPLGFSLPGCLYFSLSFPLVLIPHVISTVVSMLMPSASRPHVWAPGHHSWLSLIMATWLAHHHLNPMCLKQNSAYSKPGSLVVIRLLEELIGSLLSPPQAVMTAYSLFPLLLLNPGCLPTVPRSLVPYC